MPEDASERLPVPVPILEWDRSSIYTDWHIPAADTIPLSRFRDNLISGLISHRELWRAFQPPDFAGKTGPEQRVAGTVVNEGHKYGVVMLETKSGQETVWRTGLLVAKNPGAGSEQLKTDARLLPELRRFSAAHGLPLAVPAVHGSFAVQGSYRGELCTVQANLVEWMNLDEVSVTAASDPRIPHPFVYDVNLPEFHTIPPYLTEQTELLNRDATGRIAGIEYAVWRAFDGRIQRNWRINYGDFVARAENRALNWGIITIQDGLTEPLSREELLVNLLTHSERSFDPRVGSGAAMVTPFAVDSLDTIAGIQSAMQQLGEDPAGIGADVLGAVQRIARTAPELQPALQPLRDRFTG